MLSSADKAALDRTLARIIKDYARLDDSTYILTANLSRLKIDVDQYISKIRVVLNAAYSRGAAKTDIEKALKEFYKNLTGYLEKGGPNEAERNVSKLLDSVLNEYKENVATVTNSIGSTLYQRANVFRKMSDAVKVSSERLAALEKFKLASVTIGGETYQEAALGKLWDRMVDSYGKRDNVQYRPSAAQAAKGHRGANYPLRTYVDGRTTTTSAETFRTTMEIQSASSGILFGQIDRTGTSDSCIFHENEIVFVNDAAREIALKQFPDVARFKTMRTVQEIQADNTHMFKFNCRHRWVPIPMQYQDTATIREDLAAAPQQTVPDKINEDAIFEKINGQKHREAAA